jgi:hypothetical protein
MLVGLAVVLMLVLRARPAGDGPAGLPLGGELWADAGGQPQVAAGARPEGLFPGIDPATVETIRDNTVFRSAESDAWFGWLKLLDQMTPQELATLPAAPVGYLQLERQPSAYRGHTVRMSGIIRRAKEVATPDNPQGIERYYQLWLQPVRGEPQLVVIYALELPADFPLGDGLDAPASVTGIFYKHWAYASQSGILTAPLLLAKTIDWKPPPPAPPPPAPLNEQLLLAVAAALSIALAIVGWIVIRNRGSRRRPVADAQVTIAVPDDDQA